MKNKIYNAFGVIAMLVFAWLMFEFIGYAVIGWFYNPFTDRGFHTVVTVYRYREDPWNRTKEVTITGTIWHDMNVMSQKEIGSTDLKFETYQQGLYDHKIDSIKDSYYHIGDSIIKDIKP